MTERLEPALLTAEKLLAWRRRGSSAPLPRLSEAILTHQAVVARHLAPGLRPRRVHGLSADLLLALRSDGLVVTRNLAIGAPATAILVEELAVCGVRSIVAVDIAASLEPGLPSGSIALVQSAVIGDGTSPHYAPGAVSIAGDSGLTLRLATALGDLAVPATVWSTDAPLRETPSQVTRYRDLDASLVDMETAALFASAAALGIAAASVLVLADELFDGWHPPADMNAVQAKLRRVSAIAAGCLRL